MGFEMGVGYLIYRDILIAIDLFSTKQESMNRGEVRVLDSNKPLAPQIYEAISGNKWDSFLENLKVK